MNRLFTRLVRQSVPMFARQVKFLVPALLGAGATAAYYQSCMQVSCKSVGSVDGSESVIIPDDAKDTSNAEYNLSLYLENCVPPMRSAEETVVTDNVVYLAAKDADKYLLRACDDVFVLYASPRCDVCKMFKPVFVELAKIFAGQVGITFVIVDTSKNYTPGYLDHIESFATPTVKVYPRGEKKSLDLTIANLFMKDLNKHNEKIKEEFTTDNSRKRTEDELGMRFSHMPVPGKAMPTALSGDGIPYDVLNFIRANLTEPEILTERKMQRFDAAMERNKTRFIADMENDEDTKQFLDEIVAQNNVPQCRPQAAELLYTLLTYNNKRIGERQGKYMDCVEKYSPVKPAEDSTEQPPTQ